MPAKEGSWELRASRGWVVGQDISRLLLQGETYGKRMNQYSEVLRFKRKTH